MRKVFVVLTAILIGTWLAGAAPLCQQGTLADYLALQEGCQIDDKVFSNFTYTSAAGGGAAPVLAAGVTVNPISTSLNPGFLFTASWSVVSGQSQDSHIGYTVTVNPGGFTITDVSATMSGYGATLPGSISVAENVDSANLFLSYPGGLTSQVVDITATRGPLYVVKDISVSGGLLGLGGAAAVSGVANQFSESGIPEPLTLLLMGSGLLALGALRLRKKNS